MYSQPEAREPHPKCLPNGPIFLMYKTSEFLDNACHQNVSADAVLPPIKSKYMFVIRPMKQFEEKYRANIVFNDGAIFGQRPCRL
jgi:hypothetical protein